MRGSGVGGALCLAQANQPFYFHSSPEVIRLVVMLMGSSNRERDCQDNFSAAH